ncbi:hypothetical protein [Sphingomicrobium sediminis]|uniref:Uncharacterized protein n=1 Tax=Sphingomicrobium sediminis TaxID=2950949 RepID=A0A9X2EF89_9SPHN|nr:hypothetical protein [Sphingomicrobium sediminis]MCM8556475.1 hypothetical protein [Sphingomicrobium sediminis]
MARGRFDWCIDLGASAIAAGAAARCVQLIAPQFSAGWTGGELLALAGATGLSIFVATFAVMRLSERWLSQPVAGERVDLAPLHQGYASIATPLHKLVGGAPSALGQGEGAALRSNHGFPAPGSDQAASQIAGILGARKRAS